MHRKRYRKPRPEPSPRKGSGPIKSIELRPTFDLFLSARRELHFFGRVSSGEALIVLWFCRSHRGPPSATDYGRPSKRGRACVGPTVECYRRRSCSEETG